MLRSIFITITLLLALVTNGQVQSAESVVGANSVSFQPIQSAGNLVGCSMVFSAVQFDHVYLKGKPVLAVGNIGITQMGENIALTFKVGVKSLGGDTPFVSPTFAYLQTKKASTAKVKQVGQEIEKGFRYTAYSFFDPAVQQVVDDMMDSQKVTLAFNRKVNGLDVLIPLDLNVIDTTSPDGNSITRVRSKATISEFTDCYLTLLDQVITRLEKE